MAISLFALGKPIVVRFALYSWSPVFLANGADASPQAVVFEDSNASA
jgi:hypothetical protein